MAAIAAGAMQLLGPRCPARGAPHYSVAIALLAAIAGGMEPSFELDWLPNEGPATQPKLSNLSPECLARPEVMAYFHPAQQRPERASQPRWFKPCTAAKCARTCSADVTYAVRCGGSARPPPTRASLQLCIPDVCSGTEDLATVAGALHTDETAALYESHSCAHGAPEAIDVVIALDCSPWGAHVEAHGGGVTRSQVHRPDPLLMCEDGPGKSVVLRALDQGLDKPTSDAPWQRSWQWQSALARLLGVLVMIAVAVAAFYLLVGCLPARRAQVAQHADKATSAVDEEDSVGDFAHVEGEPAYTVTLYPFKSEDEAAREAAAAAEQAAAERAAAERAAAVRAAAERAAAQLAAAQAAEAARAAELAREEALLRQIAEEEAAAAAAAAAAEPLLPPTSTRPLAVIAEDDMESWWTRRRLGVQESGRLLQPGAEVSRAVATYGGHHLPMGETSRSSTEYLAMLSNQQRCCQDNRDRWFGTNSLSDVFHRPRDSYTQAYSSWSALPRSSLGV